MKFSLSMLVVALSFSCGSAPEPTPPDDRIGPAGGTVVSADGQARLVIPAGALSGPVAVAIVPEASVPLDGRVLKGSAYRIEPVGTTFATTATFAVTYLPNRRPNGSDEADLRLGKIDADQAVPVGGSTADPAGHTVAATTQSGGSFVALWGGLAQPCTSAESKQFDFLAANWNYDGGPNVFPGTDDFVKDASGCALLESFIDRSNTRGRSVSFYNPTTQHWYQTFVDSQGGRLEFEGSLTNGEMLLNDSPTSRWTWSPVDANHTNIRIESSSDGGATWRVVGTATLTKR